MLLTPEEWRARKLQKPLVDALRDIQTSLSALVEFLKPREQPEHPTKTSQPAAKENREPEITRVSNVTEVWNAYISKHDESEKSRKDFEWRYLRVQWLLFAATLAAFGAAAYYAYTAKKQLQATNQAYVQIEQQTRLMRDEVEGATAAIITKQFRITWPNKGYLSVILNNRGRITGKDVQADFSLVEVSLPDERTVNTTLPPWKFHIPEVEPSLDAAPERGISLSVAQEELKGSPMPRAIKLTGTFTYSNGFRKKTESVCHYVLGAVEFKDKSGMVKQSQGSSVIPCDGLPAQIDWYLRVQEGIVTVPK